LPQRLKGTKAYRFGDFLWIIAHYKPIC